MPIASPAYTARFAYKAIFLIFWISGHTTYKPFAANSLDVSSSLDTSGYTGHRWQNKKKPALLPAVGFEYFRMGRVEQSGPDYLPALPACRDYLSSSPAPFVPGPSTP